MFTNLNFGENKEVVLSINTVCYKKSTPWLGS